MLRSPLAASDEPTSPLDSASPVSSSDSEIATLLLQANFFDDLSQRDVAMAPLTPPLALA